MIGNIPAMRPPRWAVFLCLSAVVAPGASSHGAGESKSLRALIQQALDQQVDITIEKQPLSAAFELIGKKTGVKLTIRPQVVELLPYGHQTVVNAKIQNVSLRQGLSEMLSHLGMVLQVRDNDVAIEPTDPLRRVCRRVTWSELRQLRELHTTPWTSEAAAKLPFHFEIRTTGDARKELLAEAGRVGKGTVAEVLEAACDQLDWAWYPWDNWIVVLTQTDQAERFVEKPVSLRYNHAALIDVLSDLARQADLRLRLEPGVLQGLPVQTRQNFTLMMRDNTIRTALEMISGATGLAYDVTPKEIVIKHTETSKAAATQQTTVIRSHDPIVGEVSVQGKSGATFRFWIRESHLSDQLNEWRKQKIREEVRRMEQELAP